MLLRALPAEAVRQEVVVLGTVAVPALIRALRDEQGSVRPAAAKALGNIGDARATPALIEALEDQEGRCGENLFARQYGQSGIFARR